MHVTPDFQTKKALKEAVKNGDEVRVQVILFEDPNFTGEDTIEGPHDYHKWYARAKFEDGKVVKVIS